MKTLAILHVSLTVADLAAAQAFYVGALGFSASDPVRPTDPQLAALLGATNVQAIRLHRGRQVLELAAFDPPGAAYPSGRSSNDLWFQHLAMSTDDVAESVARLASWTCTAISRNGPQRLPGGITAFKFRDPEAHPLELIAFPAPDPATAGGIDHTAISVADLEASLAFYVDRLGFAVTARQVNTGPTQDALDDLDSTSVDVVGLSPAQMAPHLELLCYRNPRGRAAHDLRSADVAASRLVLCVDDLSSHPDRVSLSNGTHAALIHDPDGHCIVLLERRGVLGETGLVQTSSAPI